ncbi:SPFH domain-containing protein [Pseudoalteromonas fenneropenaei]|uniref:SPFH domain-containing protein n=1 Tax=Pseudoalteromonas fenneropenaei TaxID=1737459 RepID=A0ABV7CH12_9GAMM
MKSLQDKPILSMSGYVAAFFGVVALAVSVICGLQQFLLVAAISALIAAVLLKGLFLVNPNEGAVMQLFGQYAGTEKTTGLRWANPLFSKSRISLRVRNFDSDKVKVNDKLGNPIEIAAVVVWRVVDAAQAKFEVDDYENFVAIQSESAIRNMAVSYPYDSHQEGEVALRSHIQEVAEHLKSEIQERLATAGVEVIEARLSHLAYAQEIAHAMLQRQQAIAIVAARQTIVEGAVGMVKLALEKLNEEQIVDLDDERKAAMVSNLLVVLCGDQNTQPVINTGSLY